MPLALVGGVAQGASVAREAGNRVVALPILAGTLAGRLTEKTLRLRIVILRDEEGNAVASEADVEEAVAEARRVFEREARVHIAPAGERLVETLAEPAPPEALEPLCPEGLWRAGFGRAGAYYRRFSARAGVTGYAAPITTFVVRDVIGRAGCSLGPLGDFVAIDMGGLKGGTRRILAHEIGHSCGLPHSKDTTNLMWPRGPGERLTTLQAAVLRSSRHVAYLGGAPDR